MKQGARKNGWKRNEAGVQLMDRKGQAAIELIITAVVLVGLVLGTAAVMVQRNMEAERISAIQRDTSSCDAISGLINALDRRTGYTEIALDPLDKTMEIGNGAVLIRRESGSSVICRYNGTALFEDSEGSYTNDSTGFTLERDDGGNPQSTYFYKMKKIGIGVVFCDNSKTWC